MSRQTWQETLVNSIADGPAISATVTQGTLLNSNEKVIIPGGWWSIGTVLKVTSHGRISNVVTTPGTLLFQLLLGATVIFNNAPATIPLNIVAKTNVAYWLEIIGTVRAVGPTANIMWQGQFSSESVVGSPAGAAGSAMLLPSAPVVGGNFDSGVTAALDLQAKFSVATAGTSIQAHQFKVESLN